MHPPLNAVALPPDLGAALPPASASLQTTTEALQPLALPPPVAASQTGWPWTVPETDLPARRTDLRSWPKISIITPSFNQGRYLEETIRSVLLQGYPNLEFFIIDGGSTDESVAIIRKYERWLTGWISERDRGQCDAINKGYALCTGDLFNWICSDDLLAPGALTRVAEAFLDDPTLDAVAGGCYLQYDSEPQKSRTDASSVELLQRGPYGFAIWQPSCFFRRSLIARRQLVREDMNYCMDRELWCYLESRRARWRTIDATLSINRFTGDNKSLVGRTKIVAELDEIYRAHQPRHAALSRWLRRVWLPLVVTQVRHRSAPVRALARFASRALTFALRVVFPAYDVRLLQKEFYRYGVPQPGTA